MISHIILAILWILYCVLHSVLADAGVKKQVQARLGRRYKFYRIFYTVFSFIGLAVILFYQLGISTVQVFNPPVFIRGIGAALAVSGSVLMLVCIRKYFFSLSGLRTLFVENASNQLIISGIHRYVRHPLYLGTFAFIWGLFLIWPHLSLLVANVIITGYTLIGIDLEEQKLLAEFGEQYQDYRRTVPKLLPRRRVSREFR